MASLAQAVATMDTISQKQFVYAGTGKRLKHEDSFEDRCVPIRSLALCVNGVRSHQF